MEYTENSLDHRFIESSLQLQKILSEEVALLRELLSGFSQEESCVSEQLFEVQKELQIERQNLHKKLKSLRKEKQNYYEIFFLNHQKDCETQLLLDQLTSLSHQVEKKQTQQKKVLKSLTDHPPLKLQELPQNKLPKQLVSTIEEDTQLS